MVLDTQIYLDPPRGAKWIAKGATKRPLRFQTPPLGGCWYIYIHIYVLYIHNFILIFLFSNDWLFSPAKLVQVNTSAKKSPCHRSAKMGHRLCRTNLAVTGFPCDLQHNNTHLRKVKESPKTHKFRDVFFKSHCVTLSVLYLLLRMDFFFEKSPQTSTWRVGRPFAHPWPSQRMPQNPRGQWLWTNPAAAGWKASQAKSRNQFHSFEFSKFYLNHWPVSLGMLLRCTCNKPRMGNVLHQ